MRHALLLRTLSLLVTAGLSLASKGKGESVWTSLRLTSASGHVTYLTGPSRTGMVVPPAHYGSVVLFPGEQLEILTHRSGIPIWPASFGLARNGQTLINSASTFGNIPASVDVSVPGSYSGACMADPGEVFSFTVVAGSTAPATLQAKILVRLPSVPWVGGSMLYGLAQQGLIPCNEPYTAMGHAASSAGSEIVDGCEVLFETKRVVDWIHVELRDAADPTTIVAVRNGLLHSDLSISDIDGVSPLSFEAEPGDYRIALMHRNHLGVLSDQAFAFRGAAPMISFSGGVLISMTPPVTFIASPTCAGAPCVMHPGNTLATAQERVSYTGTNNDRDPILVRIGGSTPTNVVSGYYAEDVNMDGVVKYVGEGNDRDVLLQALGGNPLNVLFGQEP